MVSLQAEAGVAGMAGSLHSLSGRGEGDRVRFVASPRHRSLSQEGLRLLLCFLPGQKQDLCL